jgi:pilus assembly protein CpaC
MMILVNAQNKRTVYIFIVGVLALLTSLVIFSSISWAAQEYFLDDYGSKKLELVVGKSLLLRSPDKVKRVSIAAPEVADLTLISPYEIYITGKAAGTTNLTLWQNKQVRSIYDLEVSYDISLLKQKLHEILPDETQLRVIATHDSITLSGKVSSTANLSQAMALAEAFAPKNKVINLVQVAGVHQVMLEVRVAEMSRSLGKRLGFNFAFNTTGGDFGVSTLGGLTTVVQPTNASIAAGPVGLSVSPAVNALFRFIDGNNTWTGFVDALKEDGLVKVLAEPTLLALSGQTASFLAGGEFPVPVPQDQDVVTIEYKRFGAELFFTPTVLSENKISINVAPSVSELDFSTAVRFGGFVVPGLRKRAASTVVELGDGQSFAIAGLISETVRDNVVKFPILGDIPILGALFRSRQFQKNETELIIIVTPHLVKPLNLEKQYVPTDFYIEPNDVEFYLLGKMEGKKKEDTADIQGKLDGKFGHVLPISE